MILLLGGTGETREIASSLISAGFRVLVSTATGIGLNLEPDKNLLSRTGPLTEKSFDEIICEHDIRAVVDATHPYAQEITALATRICAEREIPYFRFSRPPVISESADVIIARNHREAADKAFSFKMNVLLTTGSKNLRPYIEAAEKAGVRLVARVLPAGTSVAACIHAGIPEDSIITGRGPFSVEDNIAAIRKFDIGALVTKDSGAQGGVPRKLQAARAESCKIIVVARPDNGDDGERAWTDIAGLINAVEKELP